MRPQDWKCGDRLWIVEACPGPRSGMVAPFGGTDEILKDLEGEGVQGPRDQVPRRGGRCGCGEGVMTTRQTIRIMLGACGISAASGWYRFSILYVLRPPQTASHQLSCVMPFQSFPFTDTTSLVRPQLLWQNQITMIRMLLRNTTCILCCYLSWRRRKSKLYPKIDVERLFRPLSSPHCMLRSFGNRATLTRRVPHALRRFQRHSTTQPLVGLALDLFSIAKFG